MLSLRSPASVAAYSCRHTGLYGQLLLRIVGEEGDGVYLRGLSPRDVVESQEVRPVARLARRRGSLAAGIATDDVTAGDALDVDVEGMSSRHILKGLPAVAFDVAFRVGDDLCELPPGHVAVGLEARHIATAAVADSVVA